MTPEKDNEVVTRLRYWREHLSADLQALLRVIDREQQRVAKTEAQLEALRRNM